MGGGVQLKSKINEENVLLIENLEQWDLKFVPQSQIHSFYPFLYRSKDPLRAKHGAFGFNELAR